MPRDYPRSHRVADQIQRELVPLIRDELKDPRISSMVTLTSIDVTRDLAYARVYYSVLDPAERAGTAEVLKSSAGFLRRQLGRRMQLRVVPQLSFIYDDSIEEGARMSALIDRAVLSNTTPADEPDGSADAPDQSGTDDAVR